jgi:Skp family chaperone for outer membrane proteins
MRTVLLWVLLGLLATTGAWSQNLGFVDVQRVIFEYKKTRDITESLEKKMQAHLERVRQQKASIRAKKENAEVLQGNSLQQLQALKEIKLDEVELDLQQKNVSYRLEQEIVDHMKKVYAEILREVESLARDRNLTAVFMVSTEELGGRTRAEVSSNILVHPVLWFDPHQDLTTEIIQRLNH